MATKVETCAVIEIGSNSVKFLIAQPDPIEKVKTLLYTRKITRLGEDIRQTNQLKPEAVERTVSAVEEFFKTAQERGVFRIHIFGTYALRTAENASVFLEKVREITGCDVEVLSGEEEAINTQAGALLDVEGREGVRTAVIDIGGGSTEIAVGDYRTSLPAGGLSTSQSFLHHDPPLSGELDEAAVFLRNLFKEGLDVDITKSVAAAGVGGAITSAASLKLELPAYMPDRVYHLQLNKSDIQAALDRLSAVTIDRRREMMPFDPERADSILGGLLVLRTFFEHFTVETFTVSGKNINHGVFYRVFC